MPKIAKKLAELAVRNLKKDGRYMVGGAIGLHLRIAGESRSWILRVTLNDKRCDIGLGSYPGITLSTARERANEIHNLIAKGIDPLAAKRAKTDAARIERSQAKTFRECAEAYIERNREDWKNPKHQQQWSNTLATYVYPSIGRKAVGKITADDVEAVLEPIWRTKAETAKRVRGRMEVVFDFAKSKGYREGDNPAAWKGNLRERLGKATRAVKHHASLPYSDLGSFMVDLRKRAGTSARALEFAILCASRSGEVREATWEEIDLDRALWTIPADRMKAKREHVVPLSAPAVALLRGQAAMPRLAGVDGPAYVFPAPRGGAFSDAVFRALFERMGRDDLTQHGFRSTFREWAGEVSKHPREVVEHALAHQLADKAEAAYQRGSLLPKRVVLMADWANFCAMVPTGIASIARLDEAA